MAQLQREGSHLRGLLGVREEGFEFVFEVRAERSGSVVDKFFIAQCSGILWVSGRYLKVLTRLCTKSARTGAAEP